MIQRATEEELVTVVRFLHELFGEARKLTRQHVPRGFINEISVELKTGETLVLKAGKSQPEKTNEAGLASPYCVATEKPAAES